MGMGQQKSWNTLLSWLTVAIVFLFVVATVLPKANASTPIPTVNPSQGFNNYVYAITPAGDGTGDIYVGGAFSIYNGMGSHRIVRFNSDGTVDTGFVVGSGYDNEVRTIARVGDGTGDIYVGGSFITYNGIRSPQIIRLNTDGTVDRQFAIGSGFNGEVRAIVPVGDGTGDIYVGGFFTTYNGRNSNRIIRLNSNGTVDTGLVVRSGFNNSVFTISPVADDTGDLYVGGFFTAYNEIGSNRMIRLNSDGTVDRAFLVGTGFNNSVFSILPIGDGTGAIYAGGSFTTYNGTRSNRIVRLNPDGTANMGFSSGSGLNGFVYTITRANDLTWDIYVGGDFSTYNGTRGNRMIRLNPDGTVDAGFAVGSGFNNNVYAITPVEEVEGEIYVGGVFTAYNGISHSRMIRAHPDGTIDAGFAVGLGFNSETHFISPTTSHNGSNRLF